MKLRGSMYYFKNISPAEATKEIDTLNSLIPVLSQLKTSVESIKDHEFTEFKNAALDFFETVEALYEQLQEIADIHGSYEVSKTVLAADWDRPEDDHWDNY